MANHRISEHCAVLGDRYQAVNNKLNKALRLHVIQVCKDPLLEIATPEALEDQITEWLAIYGRKFTGCRPEAVVMLNREHLGLKALRIYYEGRDASLYLLIIIGFKPSTP